MGKVDQTPFFEGLGFKRCECKWGDYHLAPSEACYRIDRFSHCYVIEDADSQDEAEKSLFEDADLFDDSKPWDWIVHEIRLRLMEYEYVTYDKLVPEEELYDFLCKADIEQLNDGNIYGKVAHELAQRLKPGIGYPAIMNALQDVFDKTFGKEHDLDELWHISQFIASGKVFPCPACGKSYFWEDLMPDQCPECGWKYEGGG